MAVRCASGSKILASRPTAELVQRWLSLHYSAIKRIIYKTSLRCDSVLLLFGPANSNVSTLHILHCKFLRLH